MTVDPAHAGAELLSASMKRRGMSAPDLASATGGRVSSSSIRGYVRGEQVPRASTAVVIARSLGVSEGAPLLRAWGYVEAADAMEEPDQRVASDGSGLSYLIEADSNVPDRAVPVGWTTGVEIIGRVETSLGVEYLARADSGTLILMRPIYGMELSPDFQKSLSEDGKRELPE